MAARDEQVEFSLGGVEVPDIHAALEQDPGPRDRRVPQPDVADALADVVLVTGQPFRIGQLSALQFERQARPVAQRNAGVSASTVVIGAPLKVGLCDVGLGGGPPVDEKFAA
ncbi:hypothetical protein R8Z50_11025 [Longispora sp. K20-0274]